MNSCTATTSWFASGAFLSGRGATAWNWTRRLETRSGRSATFSDDWQASPIMNLLYLADIRFPMERANGIQTIETCHALARDGVSVELLVRRSDSRSDASCFEFFGLAPHPNLRL